MLLKSSDQTTHDIGFAYRECIASTKQRPEQVVLVMREWFDLPKSMEFRCFVKRKKIIGMSFLHRYIDTDIDIHLFLFESNNNCYPGISQRDSHHFYDFLLEQRQQLQEVIVRMFNEEIVTVFPDDDCIHSNDSSIVNTL